MPRWWYAIIDYIKPSPWRGICPLCHTHLGWFAPEKALIEDVRQKYGSLHECRSLYEED